jgi:hypothetical protein
MERTHIYSIDLMVLGLPLSLLRKYFIYFMKRTFEFSGKDCHSFKLCMKGL